MASDDGPTVNSSRVTVPVARSRIASQLVRPFDVRQHDARAGRVVRRVAIDAVTGGRQLTERGPVEIRLPVAGFLADVLEDDPRSVWGDIC